MPETKATKAAEAVTAPAPPCPQCLTGKGRWIELAWISDRDLHSFICVTCGHFWTAPLQPQPSNVLAFPPSR